MQLEMELSPPKRSGGRVTQNDLLEEYFKRHPGIWIPMPELAQVITATGIGAAVHSRVNDLRQKRWMNIFQESRRRDGRTASFYCYQPTR